MVVPDRIKKAAEDGDDAAIRAWFATGANNKRDADEVDRWGQRLLLRSAAHGHLSTMRLLLGAGATVDATGVEAVTPLFAAAFQGHCAAAVLLLERGADIEWRVNAFTPLMIAAGSGHYDLTAMLLARGADLDARTDQTPNADACAQKNNHVAVVALLKRIRRAGDWDAYVRFPRKRLLALRVLCERGRASTDDALLARVFAAGLPREVFWHVLKFWHGDRDPPYY